MNLTPTELERLTVFSAAELARRNLREGVLLSHPEAVALLVDEVLLAARKNLAYDEVIDHACGLLDAAQCEPGVPDMVGIVAVDASFPDGTKLVTLIDPITQGQDAIRPGEVIVGEEPVQLFPGAPRIALTVVNRGDRDIQVRSQSHFFETNAALEFDRRAAWGHKLDIPSGSGVRFEPGIPVEIQLVPMAGDRVIHGFSGAADGPLDAEGALEHAVGGLS
ncbi:urease subunit beta [Mycolicibacterium vaccae]|uniref:urease n=1 Tax=Mycolicibacterium vaccae ATCC 25954 TaxID=1194972 RepID=K0V4Z0_MYCVA|nr:urease subunit beta [Mycolicibacterium vaccae]ANI40384.1 urease subunit beta [Mycolicibacterium vaccae 95051]EJZ09858.1 bifunctional urease subunit gamma/beta [Mycolicibacterium vaccae ATCC 25954]MCV7060496.1 urease subunit beta [Mycolicibacterium vaccae]